MVKMFESETCHEDDISYPKKGDIVLHKVYGHVEILSVDEQSLTAQVKELDSSEYKYFKINLTDLTWATQSKERTQ